MYVWLVILSLAVIFLLLKTIDFVNSINKLAEHIKTLEKAVSILQKIELNRRKNDEKGKRK